MKLHWTKRGIKRLQSAFDYIAENFYLDYAIQFNGDVRDVTGKIADTRKLAEKLFQS